MMKKNIFFTLIIMLFANLSFANNKFDIKVAFQKEKIVPVVVIGSGPAGFTAGYYAARAGFHTVIFTGKTVGGQLTETTYIENFPGFEKIEGFELMNKIQAQAELFGAVVEEDIVVKVDFDKWPFVLTTESGQEVNALSVIISTGAAPRRLGIPGELKYWGKGVTACATCDAIFFKNKDVVVVGGGDSAIEEAIQLATYCKSVTILVRSDRMRAARHGYNKLAGYENIKIVYNKKILEVLGNDNSVVGIKLQDAETDDISVLDIQGVFLAIGQNPNTDLFKDSIRLSKNGYIQLEDHSQATSIYGVFASGDVADSRYRQACTAAGDGAKSALEAVDWLRDNGLTDIVSRNLKPRYYKFN